MILRPITDSLSDFHALRDLYDDWKQLEQSFTYNTFTDYICRLPKLNSVLLVMEVNKIIKGSCKVILEPKLVFGTYVCHVEDVVVRKECRGQGIGTQMLQLVIDWCRKNKWDDDIRVYKIRLGCKETLEKFYKQSGFTRAGNDMVCYIKQN